MIEKKSMTNIKIKIKKITKMKNIIDVKGVEIEKKIDTEIKIEIVIKNPEAAEEAVQVNEEVIGKKIIAREVEVKDIHPIPKT
jgi:hypothetical protein